jgi:hypothetical protein
MKKGRIIQKESTLYGNSYNEKEGQEAGGVVADPDKSRLLD